MEPCPELTREFMLARAAARDPAWDGLFLTCVRTTGIYCLPSCRARAPRPENVVHCATPAEARARGFRPCRRCRPDDRYAGRDRDCEALVAALQRLRAAPGDFAGVAAFAAAAGCGETKLLLLSRRHFERTPAELLLEARLEHARDALAASRARVLDVALDAGFAGSSAFHSNFRARYGVTPRGYRDLLASDGFALRLPRPHATGHCVAWHLRDPAAAGERGSARCWHKALVLAGMPCVLGLSHRGAAVAVTVSAPSRGGRPPGPAVMAAAHRAAVRLLRLDCDPAAGERTLAADPHLRPIVRAAAGLRPWGTAAPFEALLFAILGQQVQLGFAHALRRAVIARTGAPVGDLVAHPEPAALARLDRKDLLAMGLTGARADAVLAAARAAADGSLDLESLAAGPAGTAAAALEAVRGVGPWTQQYVRMRGLGFPDCLPAGDRALQGAAQRRFGLTQRPGERDLLALAAPFAPHRSLFTFHLWRAAAGAVSEGNGRARRRTTRRSAHTQVMS